MLETSWDTLIGFSSTRVAPIPTEVLDFLVFEITRQHDDGDGESRLRTVSIACSPEFSITKSAIIRSTVDRSTYANAGVGSSKARVS